MSFLLPAETLAWAPVCGLQKPRRVPRCHGGTKRQILASGDLVHPGAPRRDARGGHPGGHGTLGCTGGPQLVPFSQGSVLQNQL